MGKFCTNCGKELGENAKFCSRCGKPTGDNMQNTPINVEHNGGKIEKKWYQTTKGICLWLVIFFPVGIYLMWKYADWKKKWKITVTILWIVLVIGKIITLGDDTSDVGKSDDVLIKNNDALHGALYNYSLEEAKNKINTILSDYYNCDMDLNQFKVNDDSVDNVEGATVYNYYTTLPQGNEFGVELTIYDNKLLDLHVKTEATVGNGFSELKDIQEIFSEIVSNMTDDELSVEEMKSVVTAGNTNAHYYRNGNMYVIGRMWQASPPIFYYSTTACTNEKAKEAGCLDL